jgi:CRISPR-associated endonuclease/helicase Cas3
MTGLAARQFTEFFTELHGHMPFPWQSMLLEKVIDEGWPDLIDLPTAHGKTACMDVAVFALAMGLATPRRIWFVVDRRIVVDEAGERAARIAERLAEARDGLLRSVADHLRAIGGSRPLEVGRLRGGAPRKIAWAGNPAQPAIITSTIDQIGSRLLFRGYGVSDFAKPIHAALAANDSLILLDEAHLARPFFQTVQAVDRFRREPWADKPLPLPFKMVVMSATPPGEDAKGEPLSRFPSAQERPKAIDHEILSERRRVTKPTELAIARKPKPDKGTAKVSTDDLDELVLDAADRAAKAVNAGRLRVAVMVNRVKTARQIAQRLGQFLSIDAQIELLTGRLRPIDRDELIGRLEPVLRSSSPEEPKKPIILVTTQCLEVGADFSFDALITECASLDALRQRFGRLARTGKPADAEGVILIRKGDVRPDEKLDDSDPVDPIYGNALARTWNWLTAKGAESIEMGIDSFEARLPVDLNPFSAPRLNAPILLPAYLDLLSQTSPRPSIEPDVALFLHGIPPADRRPRADVRAVWRNDLSGDYDKEPREQLVVGLPPLTAEMLQVPLWELRQLLVSGESEATVDADMEGGFEPVESKKRRGDESSQSNTPFVIWRNGKECFTTADVSQLRPNDVVVFSAESSTFSSLLPDAKAPPDVYERAYRTTHAAVRRLFRRLPEDDDETFWNRVLVSLAEQDREQLESRRPVEYAPGYYHLTARAPILPIDRWESDEDEDGLLYELNSLGLAEHTAQVVGAASHLVEKVLPLFSDQIKVAAALHDVGKADARFQFILRHGRRRGSQPLMAKSPFRPGRAQERKLYELSGLPDGFRHELLSMQLADVALGSNGHDDDERRLILHLIAAHHGRCRPFAPIVLDPKTEPVECSTASHGLLKLSAEERRQLTPPHRLDSGVAERFWQLTRRYGWWGLAYLEAMLRCADIHASAFAKQET